MITVICLAIVAVIMTAGMIMDTINFYKVWRADMTARQRHIETLQLQLAGKIDLDSLYGWQVCHVGRGLK